MPVFSIQRGARLIAAWNIEAGRMTLGDDADEHAGIPILQESQRYAFVITPDPENREYRITVGDVAVDELVDHPADAQGRVMAGSRYWVELTYFESARGSTVVVLSDRAAESDDEWEPILLASVYVLPSKLGEVRYRKMTDDLEAISRNLLVDLYGKSRESHDLRFAREGQSYVSPEEELTTIEAVLERLSPLLQSIQRRPASRTRSSSGYRRYWGDGRLSVAATRWLSARGLRPSASGVPILMRTPVRSEDFDVPEHRILKGFLLYLAGRSARCGEIAQSNIQAIEAEKPMRSFVSGSGPSLYETVDLPRISRLAKAVDRATACTAVSNGLCELAYLKDSKPDLKPATGGVFQRSPEYRAVFDLLSRFLFKHAVWLEGESTSAVSKLTSRLFEQWSLLQLVEAFREAGLVLREWDATLRDYLHSMFIIDFNRGLKFEGELSPELRVRIRYEPWILSRAAAQSEGETLCRGDDGEVAWSPDVVVECLRVDGDRIEPVYAAVLDCKYTARLGDYFAKTQKYLRIRRTSDLAQAVRQLWLIGPGRPDLPPGIYSDDSAVSFNNQGASCAPDEAVYLKLLVSPDPKDDAGRVPFRQFARGTLNYLRRHFEASAAAKGQS